MFASLQAKLLTALGVVVAFGALLLRSQVLKAQAEKAKEKAQAIDERRKHAEATRQVHRDINANTAQLKKRQRERMKQAKKEIQAGQRDHFGEDW